jgi:serine/threonine protein kinase/ligand-binding sensor domain-containing protein
MEVDKLMSRRNTILKILLSTLLLAAFWCPGYSDQKAADRMSKPVTDNLLSANEIDPADLGRPAFRIFTDKDGLPQNTVSIMAFDQRGYLWIGTQEGAAYYNGHKWTVVNMPNQTVSNTIRSILVASDDSIWFGIWSGGVSQLRDGKWTTFDTSSGLPNNLVLSLLETTAQDGSHAIWVGTEGGLARLEDGGWTNFDTSSGLPDNRVHSLLETAAQDGSRTLWVGTEGGLARLENGKWTIFDTSSGLPNNKVHALLETTSSNGTPILWVGTYGGGLACLEEGEWKTIDTSSGLPNNRVWSLIETTSQDGERTLWVGMEAGLGRLDNGKWTAFDTRSGLPNNTVFSLLETASPNGTRTLWAGTFGGLVRLENGKWSAFDVKSGLPSQTVYSLLETAAQEGSRRLWIGTDGGLARLENGKWTIFDTSSGLPDNLVLSLLETTAQDGGRALWVGTGNGLARLENGNWTIFTTKSGLPDNFIYSLLETTRPDGRRRLWVGTYGGLACLEDSKWTIFDTSSGLPNNTVNSLLETTTQDGSRELWVGTDGGLARLEDGKWTTFDTRSGLINNSVVSLFEATSSDGVHTLWAGTAGGGVSRFDLTAKSDKWIPLSNGINPSMLSNNILQIREDNKKRIYLFTNKGIVRLTLRRPTPDDSSEYSIYTFTTEDGLPSNECNQGASMVDSQGRVWAGTISGATMLDPSREVEDLFPKPLYIERTLLGGKERALSNASLAYNENSLSFAYALLSYFRESDTRYRTELIGLDREPSDWTANTYKEYPTLPEGSYTFKVWGKDYAGNISGPVKISFEIRPALWRTWWAYILYFMVLASIGYGGHRYHLQTLERRNRILEAKVIERTDELAKKNVELARKNQELGSKNEELILSHQRADRIFSALAEALPGTVLDGKYRLDDKIGSGGFGAVYRGTHLAMKRRVAIKVFKPLPGNDSAEALDRFLQEAVSTCRINHPNAVAVLDSGISPEGNAYLVMELLEGHTLTSELQKKGRLSVRRCADILLPICDVLSKAHSMGIVHRDIKPDNIFLHQSQEGEVVKVVDFGIAKLLEAGTSMDLKNLTATGRLIGTPIYISPERFENKPYDGRSDVYSVGVMLYEMLCGQPPFLPGSGGFIAIMTQHLMREPASLREKDPNIPNEVEAIVMRSLVKEPENRPTAKELAQEFAMALGIDISTPILRSDGADLYKLVEAESNTLVIDPGSKQTELSPNNINEPAFSDITTVKGQINLISPRDEDEKR